MKWIVFYGNKRVGYRKIADFVSPESAGFCAKFMNNTQNKRYSKKAKVVVFHG